MQGVARGSSQASERRSRLVSPDPGQPGELGGLVVEGLHLYECSSGSMAMQGCGGCMCQTGRDSVSSVLLMNVPGEVSPRQEGCLDVSIRGDQTSSEDE
jgi:hypothetical protein